MKISIIEKDIGMFKHFPMRCCPALVANLLSNLPPPRKGRSNMGL